ncbi:Auxin transporter-like protein 3 [Vitis vinifera]|uniref:Auxin transporter-like protein 3 n=1 Tax=Vitis vinifera TaxID=29760 RepID=A0A438C3J2_VITVI|nr:Auxin transporter-like protein 3 [Vitis vinifera]
MASEKVETIVAGNYLEMEREEGDSKSTKSRLSALFWHGGSVYDAWFSCASNQALMLLCCPSASHTALLVFATGDVIWNSLSTVLWVDGELDCLSHKRLLFNCTFLLFGSVIQLIACASNIYYINDNFDKRTWTYIFGACCATTVFIPSFHNYRIWSFLGLMMTTYTSWYLTIASFIHGQVEGVKHSGPTKMVLYFTGATNILYTFGGDNACNVEAPKVQANILDSNSLCADPNTAVSFRCLLGFWDMLLNHSNAFSLLPRSGYRDTAVILMLIHQFITFGFACTPLYFVWGKVRRCARHKECVQASSSPTTRGDPHMVPAIIFPFFGPINSTVGSLLVSFTVYIIPALAHMITFLRHPLERMQWRDTVILRRLGRRILNERLCGGMDFGGGIRVWRVGKHAQLHSTN